MKHLRIFIPLIVFSLVLLLIYGVGIGDDKKTDKKECFIGKYVYVDTDGILHTKNRCVVGMQVTDPNENSYYKGVEFIDTVKLTSGHIRRLCSWCVEDGHYELLQGIAERNEIIDYIPDNVDEEDDEYWEQFVIDE